MIANQNGCETKIKAKLLLLGDGAVGKTSLRKRIFTGAFSDNYLMTIGASFSKKDIKLKGDFVLESQIWDLAGQDTFAHVTARFMMGAAGALVVFDLTRKQSAHSIGKWIDRMNNFNKGRDVPFIIVGNKADLTNDKHIHEFETYIEYFLSHHPKAVNCVEFIPTSAKTGKNVIESFTSLGETIRSNSGL